MATTLRFLNRSPDLRIRLVWDGTQLLVVKEAEPGSPQAQALAREAQALQELAPLAGLPRLIGAGEGHLTRQFLPGQTLQALRHQRPIPRPQLAAWLTQLGALLGQIHDRGWWHGDLSPDNLLIGPDQQISLLDWGGPHWGTPPYALPGQQGPPSDKRALSVLAQELLGSTDVPAGYQCLRLVGRQPELARLLQAWQAAPFQESTWVGVAAPSGGGKTAFLRELLWHAPHVAWGQGTTLATPVSYVLFQSLLENAHWPLSPNELEESLWRQFALTFPAAAPHQTSPDLPQSALTPLLLGEAWCEVLRARCQHHPLLLILDDVQWMDESSLALLASLAQRVIPGLMVVLAWRQEELDWPDQIPLRFRLELPPLQADQVLLWAESEAIPLQQTEAQQLTDWTQGSPLLIAEWLRHPGRPQFSAKAGLLLQNRVSEIPAPIRQVLQLAALMGSDFELEPLALAGDAAAAVTWGEDHQLLLPGRCFSHDQVREALLADLDPTQLRQNHSRLARFYETQAARPQLCAFHYWEAGQPELAAPFALQAARLERDRSALSSAAYFYRLHARALACPETTLELTRVLHLLGHNQESIEWLQRALDLPGAAAWKAELYLALGLVYRAQNDSQEAYRCTQQAWAALKQAGLDSRRPLPPLLLSLQLETSLEMHSFIRCAYGVCLRLPAMISSWGRDQVLTANFLAALDYLGCAPYLRSTRSRQLRKVRRLADPLTKAKVLNRLWMYQLGAENDRTHRRQLSALAPVFEKHGDPWELSMTLMQLGLYAGVRGDFPELQRLAKKILELVNLSNDQGQGCVALNFQVIASGARVSLHRLNEFSHMPGSVMFSFHALIARAQYLLHQGKSLEALRLMEKGHSLHPLASSMICAWTASAARQTGEATPRRWGQQRAGYFHQAIKAARKGLKSGPVGRIYWFRAKREMALALLGLARDAEAQPWLRQSIEEAARYGATYEEALSRQAWGRLGADLGWPLAEQEAKRARDLLERLGAWWDLVPNSAGLPLEEVGEAAHRYLDYSDAAARDQLCRWAGSDWLEHLDLARERSRQVRHQLEEAQRRLQQESDRWRSFLQRGPVAVQRFDAQGACLEGEHPLAGAHVRVDLDAGEYAVLTLPVAHSQFSLCQRLLASEVNYLQERLAGHSLQAERLAQSSLKELLRQGLRELQRWHLGSDPVEPEEAFFWQGLDIQRQGEIPWPRLGPQGRATLLAILREALQNLRKHGQAGPIEMVFTTFSQELTMSLGSRGAAAERSSRRRSFGLESMRFRASLAGGRLHVGEDFSLGLSLPLKSPAQDTGT